MIRAAVAAPTPAMRMGLRGMLSSGEIEVVGEAASLAESVEELGGVDVLVVADDELLEETARSFPGEKAPALVLLAGDELAAGTLARLQRRERSEEAPRAWGIVPADATPGELQAAVVAAAQGLIVMSPSLARSLLTQGRPGPDGAIEAGELDEPLTAREREVLELLSQGLPNKIIARRLQISEHTVKFHVSSIYGKLGASSRIEAVSRGARQGLISF